MFPTRWHRHPAAGFTLVELLVVVGILGLLVALLLPSLGAARDLARGTLCATRMRNLGYGFLLYAQRHNDVMLPGRFGTGTAGDAYWVGNGYKYRPRWVAAMGYEVGVYPFFNPSPVKDNGGDRQDYDSSAYLDPAAPEMSDERNHGYGYNHHFLGNARDRTGGGYRNWPVMLTRIRCASETVVAVDGLGTAAAYPRAERLAYENNGTNVRAIANHAWSLDPPRLTARSDRGTGDFGSPRTGVDPRHRGKVNTLFVDSHVAPMTPGELGYDVAPDGSVTDAGNNRLFSGTGQDDDPPAVW